jgi:hypothetical protein
MHVCAVRFSNWYRRCAVVVKKFDTLECVYLACRNVHSSLSSQLNKIIFLGEKVKIEFLGEVLRMKLVVPRSGRARPLIYSGQQKTTLKKYFRQKFKKFPPKVLIRARQKKYDEITFFLKRDFR